MMEIKLPFTTATAERFDTLYQFLSRKFCMTQLEIAVESKKFQIFAVKNIDKLLDELIFADHQDVRVRDERLPYWAEVWPSSLALAKYILKNKVVDGKTDVLEIGCGLGIAGMCAACLDASVVLTDYQEDALRFAELNWLINLGFSPATAVMDWRDPNINKKFDVILASDVVYEKRFFWPVINTFEALLNPRGVVYLCEPNRSIAVPFFNMLQENDFNFCKNSEEVNFRDIKTNLSIYKIKKYR